MDFIVFIAAMAALVYGADFIIKESERIALHFNISHFVIGATLVAFGTSLPEMAASMMASGQGKSDMAVANVIGSVMFNLALGDDVILGFRGIGESGLETIKTHLENYQVQHAAEAAEAAARATRDATWTGMKWTWDAWLAATWEKKDLRADVADALALCDGKEG